MNATLSHVMVGTHFMQRLSTAVEREICPPSARSKARILFVEDDYDCRIAFSAVFRDAELQSYTVEFAESVNQAMALIATRVYDAAILDYQLPDGTAKELVETWREYGYELPFVVVSGFSVAREAKEIGASGFIEKMDACNPKSLSKILEGAMSSFWRRRCS